MAKNGEGDCRYGTIDHIPYISFEGGKNFCAVAYHGIGTGIEEAENSKEYGNVKEKLVRRGASLYFPEIPGHGKYDGFFTVNRLSDDMEKFLSRISSDYPEGKTIPLGFSMSGYPLMKTAGRKEFRERTGIKKIGIFYSSTYIRNGAWNMMFGHFSGKEKKQINGDGLKIVHIQDKGRRRLEWKLGSLQAPFWGGLGIIFRMAFLETGLPKKDMSGLEIFYAYGGNDRIIRQQRVRNTIKLLKENGASVYEYFYTEAVHGFPETMDKAIDEFLEFAKS